MVHAHVVREPFLLTAKDHVCRKMSTFSLNTHEFFYNVATQIEGLVLHPPSEFINKTEVIVEGQKVKRALRHGHAL